MPKLNTSAAPGRARLEGDVPTSTVPWTCSRLLLRLYCSPRRRQEFFVHAGKFPGFFFYRPGTGPYLAPSGQCSLELYTRVELTQTQHGFAWKSCNYRKQKDLHVGALPSKAMLRCLVSD